MEGMQDLKRVQAEVTRMVEAGELDANETSPNSADNLKRSLSTGRLQPLMTRAQAVRREAVKRMILRYQAEKGLDSYSDDDLRSYVLSYDEHFTHAGIPTDRLKDVYLEAMRAHGTYLLKVDDYLRAWERIKPSEGRGADLRPMGARGRACSICHGTGMTEIFVPNDPKNPGGEGETIQKECPYHCEVVTAVMVRW
jgi:hypothetical protein